MDGRRPKRLPITAQRRSASRARASRRWTRAAITPCTESGSARQAGDGGDPGTVPSLDRSFLDQHPQDLFEVERVSRRPALILLASVLEDAVGVEQRGDPDGAHSRGSAGNRLEVYRVLLARAPAGQCLEKLRARQISTLVSAEGDRRGGRGGREAAPRPSGCPRSRARLVDRGRVRRCSASRPPYRRTRAHRRMRSRSKPGSARPDRPGGRLDRALLPCMHDAGDRAPQLVERHVRRVRLEASLRETSTDLGQRPVRYPVAVREVMSLEQPRLGQPGAPRRSRRDFPTPAAPNNVTS